MKKLILAAAAFASLAAVSVAMPASAEPMMRGAPHRVVVGEGHYRDFHRHFVYHRFHHRHGR